ncbi:TPA: hypothetical protein I7730_15965 [Vibrio vulnificus]|uniref:Uncharacterized protein n=1 Tax=Vibrio vulnificus TaxID=672 RepID=A0A8H9N1Z1_VIBVL|nr:hypothetical protein [Vibrio vulnificus]
MLKLHIFDTGNYESMKDAQDSGALYSTEGIVIDNHPTEFVHQLIDIQNTYKHASGVDTILFGVINQHGEMIELDWIAERLEATSKANAQADPCLESFINNWTQGVN